VLGVREEIGYAVSSRHRNNLCECIFFLWKNYIHMFHTLL